MLPADNDAAFSGYRMKASELVDFLLDQADREGIYASTAAGFEQAADYIRRSMKAASDLSNEDAP